MPKDSIIDNETIATLRVQLAAASIHNAELAKQFQAASTETDRTHFALRYCDSIARTREMEMLLKKLEDKQQGKRQKNPS